MVRRLVAALPTETREAVFLFYLEERSTREIGGILGKSPNAVSRLLKYGREKLRAELWAEGAVALRGLRPAQGRIARTIAALPLGAVPWAFETRALETQALEEPSTHGSGHVLSSAPAKILAVSGGLAASVLALVLWSGSTSTLDRGGIEPGPGGIMSEGPGTEARLTGVDPRGGPDNADASGLQARLEALLRKIWETPADEQEEPPQVLRVTGTVMDGRGYALAGAHVFVATLDDQPVGRIETTTQADGSYRLEGTYGKRDVKIYASAMHFMMQSRGLATGEHTHKGVDFTLPAAKHSIAGEVVDSSGRPLVARVDLRLPGHSYSSPPRGGTYGGYQIFTWTDADGHFDLGVSYAGRQAVAVYSKGYSVGFFSGIEEGTRDARFELVAGARVLGRVLRADGSPASGVRVRAEGDGLLQEPGGSDPLFRLRLWESTSVTDAEGRYRLSSLAPNVVWDLEVWEASGAKGADRMLAVRRGLRLEDGDAREINFSLEAVARVSGIVRDPGTGLPTAGLHITAEVLDPNALGPPAISGAAVLGLDGRFAFDLPLSRARDVRIDLFYQDISHPSAFGLAGGHPPMFTLAPGEERELELELPTPFSARVRVADDDGRPVPNAPIFLRTLMSPSGTRENTLGSTDRAGGHVRLGLRPDTMYQVLATDPTQGFVQEIAGQNFREIGHSERFTGAPGEQIEISIRVVTKGGIEGTLTDELGAPLRKQRFEARALLADGETTTEYGETAAEGAFVLLRAVPSGHHDTVVLRAKTGEEEVRVVVLEDFEVGRDEIVNVGPLTMKAQAEGAENPETSEL